MEKTINERFQDFLKEKAFSLQTSKDEEGYLYQGRLQVSDYHIIDFAIQLQDGQDRALYQIVYNYVAYCSQKEDRHRWLEVLNDLNATKAGAYYFCLDDHYRVFARYVGEVIDDFEVLFHILTSGGQVIRTAVAELEKNFGPSIHF